MAAALTHGVPHPTGYPVYQLVLASALKLAQGEPARIGNWLSAISAALAVMLLTDLARRTLAEHRWRNIAALASGLIFATSPGLWSQAVITEVYRAERAGRSRIAVADVVLARGRGRRSADMALADGRGPRAWPGPGQPPDPGAHVAGVDRLDVAAAASNPSSRIAAEACSAPWGSALGLAMYAYLPWAAGRVPPVNWGNPSTPEGFAWLASGAIYRNMIFGVPLVHLPGRLAAWGVRPADNSAAERGAC